MSSVEIVHLPGCASSDLARRRVEEALQLLGRHDVAVRLRQVGSEEAMAAGSPSIVLDGRDLFTTAEVAGGRACRVYLHSTGGAEGAPELGAVLEALRAGLALSADLAGGGVGESAAVMTRAIHTQGRSAGLFRSPPRVDSEGRLERLADRLLPTGIGQWIFFGAVVAAVSLAPNLPRRWALALAAVATLAGSAWCLVNFWRCREAHCILSGSGWALLGALGLVEAGIGHSLVGDYGGVLFFSVLVLAYSFEFIWRARYGTNALTRTALR